VATTTHEHISGHNVMHASSRSKTTADLLHCQSHYFSGTPHINKKGNVRVNVILRCVRKTIIAMEKQ
jgi:hypothetical protein